MELKLRLSPLSALCLRTHQEWESHPRTVNLDDCGDRTLSVTPRSQLSVRKSAANDAELARRGVTAESPRSDLTTLLTADATLISTHRQWGREGGEGRGPNSGLSFLSLSRLDWVYSRTKCQETFGSRATGLSSGSTWALFIVWAK